MKVTVIGVIWSLKNLGVWLASYKIADIKADMSSFLFAFLIYAFINIPSDLLLLNHYTEGVKKDAVEEYKTGGV